MNKVTIYQFEVYSVENDAMNKSRRWGTRKAIKEICCGKELKETAMEVDEKLVASDIPGLTALDFNPNQGKGGFQKTVDFGY